MAKFFGEVGYGRTEENPENSGKWIDVITEQSYFGDVLSNRAQNQPDSNKLNDDLILQNRISIMADQYAIDNFQLIKYVRWDGVLWTVSSVDASQRPRLILSIGKVYNGPTA